MITNVEQDRRHLFRRGAQLDELRTTLGKTLGREPEAQELATELGVSADDLHAIQAANTRGYHEGGFKIWDISHRASPKLIAYQKTHGFGVHRFDMDERYAYISTEMPGYLGNILVIYDLEKPDCPEEISRWWLPGQHIAGWRNATVARLQPSLTPRASSW